MLFIHGCSLPESSSEQASGHLLPMRSVGPPRRQRRGGDWLARPTCSSRPFSTGAIEVGEIEERTSAPRSRPSRQKTNLTANWKLRCGSAPPYAVDVIRPAL